MTTEATERDLVTEVEELLAKARVHALYERETIKNRDVTELLRRLVEEVKRLALTEQEVKLLTDYHYYEAEKAVTRRGDKAQQQIHLERLAALRNRDHHA